MLRRGNKRKDQNDSFSGNHAGGSSSPQLRNSRPLPAGGPASDSSGSGIGQIQGDVYGNQIYNSSNPQIPNASSNSPYGYHQQYNHPNQHFSSNPNLLDSIPQGSIPMKINSTSNSNSSYNTKPTSTGMRSSASQDEMPPPPTSSFNSSNMPYSSFNSTSSLSDLHSAQSAPISRGQSAFNFLLSKAKSPFSNNQSQSSMTFASSPPPSHANSIPGGMEVSSSSHSLSSQQGGSSRGGGISPEDRQLSSQQQQLIHQHQDGSYSRSASMQSNLHQMQPGLHHTNQSQGHHQYNNQPNIGQGFPSSSSTSFGSRRPSLGTEDYSTGQVSSPTKRGFFSNIGGRDRKVSNNSSGNVKMGPSSGLGGGGNGAKGSSGGGMGMIGFGTNPKQREGSNHSVPIGGTSPFNPNYSKSQNDLHSNPSPSSGSSNDLPPVPSLNPSSSAVGLGAEQYLKSPSPNSGFSRSVDDLSASAASNAGNLGILRANKVRGNTSQNSSQRYQSNASNTSGWGNSGQRSFGSGGRSSGNQFQQAQGNWGEYGYVSSNSDWRPSDMGAISSNSSNRDRQTSSSSNNSNNQSQSNSRFGSGGRAGSNSSLNPHARSESLLSNVPIYQQPQPSVPPIPNQHLQAPESRNQHQRKTSKISSGQGGLLSAALGIGSSGSIATPLSHQDSAVNQVSPNLSVMPPLPLNSIHQGFLSRNSNISLTLDQLNNSNSFGSSGHTGEKDISKGWKPYRVVLGNDGRLLFYKPGTGGNVAEEVKSLFPAGLVRNEKESKDSTASSTAQNYANDLGIDVESLKKGGLGTHDLLLATSSGTSSTSPSNSATKHTPPPPLPSSKTSNSNFDIPASASSSSTVNQKASKHPLELETSEDQQDRLTSSKDNPGLIVNRSNKEKFTSAWGNRIQSGTLRSLAFEFVHNDHCDLNELDGREASKQIDSFVFPLLFSLLRLRDLASGLQVFVTELESQVSAFVDSKEEVKSMIRLKMERLLEAIPLLLVEVKERTKIVEDLEKLIRKLWSAEQAPDGSEAASSIVSTHVSSLWEIPSFDEKGVLSRLSRDWRREGGGDSNDECSESSNEILSELSIGRISEQTLLKLEPLEFAQQIQVFHSERLRALVCPRLLASQFTQKEQGEDGATDASNQRSSSGSSISLFSYDSTSPHFLTKLVLDQIFSPDLEAPKSRSNSNHQTPPYRRAAIIRHWVRISSVLLSFNDLNGWLAIATALCSRSISRLESTWRLVPQTDRVLIGKVWAPQLAKLGWVDGVESHVNPLMMNISSSSSSSNTGTDVSKSKRSLATIPYFGDLCPAILRELAFSSLSASSMSSEEDILEVSSFQKSSEKLFLTFKSWTSEWSAGTRELEESSIPSVVPAKREYQLAFQLLAESSSEIGASSGTNQYLQASLRVEPKSLGNVDLRWKLPKPEQVAMNSFAPLRFSEALPHLHLIPRQDQTLSSQTSSSSNLRSTDDQEGTVLARSHNRPALNASPLARASKSFSSPPSSRNANKEIAFSSVSEFGTYGTLASASVNSPISSLPTNNSSLSPLIGASPVEEESLIKIGGELILRVRPESAGSNPSSPRASRRLSSDMASITRSRPVSQISKRSSLPASNRNSIIEIGTPMQVTIKAATLERLVDVLVMGVSHLVASLSQDPSDGTLSPTRRVKLSIDLEAYRSCFLATFRSLCSPMVLFEFLRKRFIAAENASRELSLPEQHRPSSQFPSWSMMPSSNSQADPIDTEIVSKIRLGVIDVLKTWVKKFSQDFADDADLFEGIYSFLRQTTALLQEEQEEIHRISLTRTSGPQEGESLSERIRVFPALEDLEKSLRIGVLSVNNGKEIGRRKHQTPSASKPTEPIPNPPSGPSSSSSTIDLDSSSPAELLEYLEVVGAIFFDKVHVHDLLIATEIFENQASDPLGWFSAKFGPSRSHGEDEIPTLSMYKLLEIVRPIKKDAKSLLSRLPIALIDVCAAQNLIIGWVTLQIVEPKIGLARRQARMEKLIDSIWLCRARMLRLRQEDQTSFSPDAVSPFREATIASFLECAITSSLTATESRMFIRAWQGVASSRNASGDNLADLLPSPQNVASLKDTVTKISTPDVGWILSCLAEAISKPSDLDSSESSLINFERCRSVWSIIDSAMRFRPFDPTTIEMANVRLKTLQHQLGRFAWDQRAMREDAAQEAANSPISSSSRGRSYRPLTSHLGAQQDKKRSDRLAFDLIEAELRPNHQSSARPALEGTGSSSVQGFSRAAAAKLLSPSTSNQAAATAVAPTPAEKKTRRMTALFRGAVRPMGLMTEKTDKEKVEITSRPYGELLSLTPLNKPGLVAGCAGAHVAVWPNSQRSYVFHLTSQEGHKYLLQAPSQAEMVDWCSHIERMAKEMTVTGKRNDGKKSASNQRGKVVVQALYGVDLSVLVEREGRDIPIGLERMLAEVEARGLREQGIYRISGAKSAIQTLKEIFGREPPESIDLSTGEFSDVHTISGAIKQWFRDLPEPPVPFNCYHSLIDAEKIESHDDRLYAIKDLVWSFPKPHFDLLRRVAEHLARVVDEGATNLMQAHNLGLIFGTFLLNPPPGPSAVAESFGNIGKAAHIVKIILTHNEWLFEPEAEVEAEPEADKRTAEQDGHDVALLEAPHLDGEDASSSIAPSPVSKDVPLPVSETISVAQIEEQEQSPKRAQNQDSLHPSDSELETASEGRGSAHEQSQEELDNVVELRSNSTSDTSPSSLKTIPPPVSTTEMMRSDSAQTDASLPSAAVSPDLSASSLSPTPRLRVRDNNFNTSSRGREESVYLDATESFATLQAFEFQSPARSSLPPQDKEGEAEGMEELQEDGAVEREEQEEQARLNETITIDSDSKHSMT